MAIQSENSKNSSASPVQIEPNGAARRSPNSSRTTLILWLVAAGMATLFLPLWLVSMTLADDAKVLAAELSSVRAAQTSVPTPPLEVQKILTPLAQTQGQIAQLSRVYPTLAAPRVEWTAVMSEIGRYDPNQIVLVSLTRTDYRVTVSGRAVREDVVLDYAHALEQTGLFAHTTVQSLQVAPTITPTTTRTPRTPVPMPNGFVLILELKATRP